MPKADRPSLDPSIGLRVSGPAQGWIHAMGALTARSESGMTGGEGVGRWGGCRGGLADAGHGGVGIADEELDHLGGAHDLVDHAGTGAAVNQTFIRGAVQKGGPGLLI